ncbi:MAG: hypothetical protein JW976_00920, partial [Syntrophaceae bacterium]|nr:hypothetical protein [Syntrophaceae bacterium]
MNPLKPEIPYVWPETRVLKEMCTYEQQPPFGELVQRSHFLFGIVSSPTTQGIDVLNTWMSCNNN